MTKHQLEKQRELDERLREEEAQERAMAAKRELDEATYTKAIVGENINRALEGVVAARSVEGALAALTVQEPEGDKHPENQGSWEAGSPSALSTSACSVLIAQAASISKSSSPFPVVGVAGDSNYFNRGAGSGSGVNGSGGYGSEAVVLVKAVVWLWC
ncbi:uncharacterized protein HaLaN_11729, partial [Haematococcus lacustris]